jgi:hypothetical protein
MPRPPRGARARSLAATVGRGALSTIDAAGAKVVIAAAATLCLLFGGDAAAAADPGRGAAPIASPADEQPASTTDTVFTDHAHLVDPQPLPFRTWSRLGDDDAVRVHFTAGTPRCFGVHATVKETEDSVQIAVSTGALSAAADRMCVAVAVLGALDVPLSRPLGDRAVLSAA